MALATVAVASCGGSDDDDDAGIGTETFPEGTEGATATEALDTEAVAGTEAATATEALDTEAVAGTEGATATEALDTAAVAGSEPDTEDTDSIPAHRLEEDLAACEERVNDLGLQVSYIPHAVMSEGQTEQVGAVVTIQGGVSDALPGDGDTAATVVDLADASAGCVLSAALTGGKFEISPSQPVEQSFVGVESLTWTWHVTPTEAGELTLTLTITPVVLDREFGPTPGKALPFTARIAVEARPDNRSAWEKANDVLSDPIPATLLFVVVGGLALKAGVVAVRKWRDRRGETESRAATTPTPGGAPSHAGAERGDVRSEYEDFRLVLTSRGDVGGQIYDVVAYSGGGKHRGTFEMPFTDDELDGLVFGVARSDVDENATRDAGLEGGIEPDDQRERLKERGTRLASALLRDSVLDGFEDSRARARRDRKLGVRLTLSLEGSSPLLNVPWEVLYHDTFLATQRSTPVVRQLADTRTVEGPPPIDTAIQILGVVASPSGLGELGVDEERRKVEAAIAQVDKERVSLTWLEPATWDQLREVLLRPPAHHVLHFVGHSAYREDTGGVLYFENPDDGTPHEIMIEDLRVLLGDEPSLRLVVLNSCEAGRTPPSDAYGGVATGLIDLGIPAVVAMQYKIRDDSAIDFAAALYHTLIDQQHPIAAAVSEARKALFGEQRDPLGWCTPVLYVAEPDVELFDFKQPPAQHAVDSRPSEAPNGPWRQNSR